MLRLSDATILNKFLAYFALLGTSISINLISLGFFNSLIYSPLRNVHSEKAGCVKNKHVNKKILF